MQIRLLVFLLSLLIPMTTQAQKLAVSTDMLGYADFATINGEASYSVSRHWSANAGFRYNPFVFQSRAQDEHLISNRQRTFSAGARYWPWHVFSGWWISGKFQYQEYNRGGIRMLETREGDRYGAGAAAGFTYMLYPWLNLELSLGAWAGKDRYVVYECPECGVRKDEGETFYVLPNDMMLSLSFVF